MTTLEDRLTTADRAFLAALTAWGGANITQCLQRLSEPWRAKLGAAPKRSSTWNDAEEARVFLGSEHAEEARPSPDRVHISWLTRALQDESESIRRTVIGHASPAHRAGLCDAFDLDAALLSPQRTPHPDVLRWTLALWSERLVGGPAVRTGDAPVISAIVFLDSASFRHLLVLIGLAKRALDPDDPGQATFKPRDRERWDAFRERWGPIERRRIAFARHDTFASPGTTSADLTRLGLLTIGRLLGTVEPHRARWALQQLPYSVAKVLRTHMKLNSRIAHPLELAEWESKVLAAAQLRLEAEAGGTDGPEDPS